MSTPPQAQPAKPAARVPVHERREIRIVQHSPVLYWWPVWAFGFLMALITFMYETRLAILPPNPIKIETSQKEEKGKAHEVQTLTLELSRTTQSIKEAQENDRKPGVFPVHMADTPYVGTIFACILMAVVIITNVPLRGMWSIMVIMLVVILIIFFTLLGWWGGIYGFFRDVLHVYINAGGYVFISTVLCAIWLVTVFFFDPQVYMVFSPRQLTVRQQIGGGEITHDTVGMVVQKHRDDLFRHWILGLGSGDLLVKVAGANPQEYHFHNVAWVGQKLAKIEEMMREQAVVQG
jgi:hypothetical protein